MQIIDDTWVLRAQEIAEKRKEILPPRAVVFDRNGRKIVSNKTYYNLMFIESNIKKFFLKKEEFIKNYKEFLKNNITDLKYL